YDLDLQIYTQNVDGKIISSNLEEIITEFMIKYIGVDMSAMSALSPMGSMSSMSSMSAMGSNMTLWQELLPAKDGSAPINQLIYDQYDCIAGEWPKEYNEIVLVVDKNNELDDVTLYALGLVSAEHIDELANSSLNGAPLKEQNYKWSYDEILNAEYKSILAADCYRYDEATGLYIDLRDTDAGLRYLYDNALTLKVTGIIRPNEESDTHMLSGTIGYTNLLTKYLIEKSENTDIIKSQLGNPNTDILSGLPFDSSTGQMTDSEKETAFREHIASLNDNMKAQAYVSIKSIPSDEFIKQQIDATLGQLTRSDLENMMIQNFGGQVNVYEDEIKSYFSKMTDEELNKLFADAMEVQLRENYAKQVSEQMANIPLEQLLMGLEAELATYTTEQCAKFYDEIMTFSESTYEENLKKFGYFDLESPSMINLYASSFENKDVIVEAIDKYNDGVEELKQIKYTDYLGIMMSSITTIINAITYVLIAFVSISLIVSSIMIGVITLISVQERTKEIGILRAIGASKKDVSGMFNAETMIVGFTSGLFGVVITYLLTIPINIILYYFTGIANLKAILPLPAAIILVAISVLLTLISGIIPSRSAAKKDPVVALRTE
ncbi:MAG: ABC transporter permease, partial [Clostridia bacterium]|nr:ABC transporter permease [Clostridia bacterium]